MCNGLGSQLSVLSGPDLATSIWALARLGIAPPGVVPAFLKELLARGATKMGDCRAAQLADLAWGMARLQVGHQSRSMVWYLCVCLWGWGGVGWGGMGWEIGDT